MTRVINTQSKLRLNITNGTIAKNILWGNCQDRRILMKDEELRIPLSHKLLSQKQTSELMKVVLFYSECDFLKQKI